MGCSTPKGVRRKLHKRSPGGKSRTLRKCKSTAQTIENQTVFETFLVVSKELESLLIYLIIDWNQEP